MKSDLLYAKKLIEENLETKDPYLDLGNCGITNLEELSELFECTHLETLILSNVWYDYKKQIIVSSKNKQDNNRISSITKNISKLQNLKKLVLSSYFYNNEIKLTYNHWKISDIRFLKDLKQLNSLDLTGNEIPDFSFLKDLKQLKSLKLTYNKISDIRFLKDLKQLNSLDLSGNEISNIRFLKDLKQLNSLDLSGNEISDFSFLKDLKQLKSLDLSDNQVFDISSLKGLKQLKSLDLSFNKISDINFLKDLIQLNSLNLSENRITNISSLKYLIQLNSLNLNNNQIFDISSLKDLKQLDLLDLYNNEISDISFLKDLKLLKLLKLSLNEVTDISSLKDLKQLKSLDLSYNKISDIDFLKDLKQLKSLDLSYNKISDIRFLKDLKQLNSLKLTYNKISDISYLKDLKQLKSLDLSYNKISDIRFLKDLKQLNSLDLSENKISDISYLKDLKQLNSLDLSQNKISDISYLKDLKQLNSLNLRFNNIADISFLNNLKQLHSLNLEFNKISIIPEFIFHLNNWDRIVKNITYDNPITNPPIEKITQGKKTILEWFRAKEKRLNEIKIILIGDAKSGKTTLLKLLQVGAFDEKIDQTDGVNIVPVEFKQSPVFKKHKLLHNIRGLFWDFGGQEIMSAAHKIFLSDNTIYILLFEARKDGISDKTIKDKVKEISTIASKSPIIIVSNKLDETPYFDFSNKYEIQKEFSQVKDFINISCKEKIGINKLAKKLAKIISNEDSYNKKIDIKNIELRNLLIEETKKNAYIDRRKFNTFCKKANIQEELKETSIDFLHKLGIALHFNNIFSPDFFVLDPNWITTGIYRIITSKRASKERNGVLNIRKDLPYILNEEKAKEKAYNPFSKKHFKYNDTNEIQFIAEVLVEHKLGFFVDNKTKIVLPDIIKANPQDYLKEPFETYKLAMAYSFEYLSTNIINQIIIKSQDLDLIDYWRNGFVAKTDNSKVLLNADSNKILIKVLGDDVVENRNFIGRVQGFVDEVIEGYIDKIEIEKEIPIPSTNEFVSVETIKDYQRNNEPYYVLHKPVFRKILVSELLDGVDYITPIQNKLLNNQDEILKKITESNKQIVELIYQNQEKIIDEINKYSQQNQEIITNELTRFITMAFEVNTELRNEEINNKLKEINNKSNFDVKIKLAVPLLNQLTLGAINIETEFDIKNWSKEMYNKYGFKIFEMFGGII